MIANDLHAVLQHISVNGPIVLVGHSIGGEYIRIYAAMFPSQVAGLVLVDSTHPDQREPAIMLSPVSRMPTLARRVLCGLLPVASSLGVIRFMHRNTPEDVAPEFALHREDAIRALRDQRVKGFETELFQGCAATQGGAVQPASGSGNIEVTRLRAGPEIWGTARSSFWQRDNIGGLPMTRSPLSKSWNSMKYG
jgi:pimeloyl-ACP methyl ester carboxylesterase